MMKAAMLYGYKNLRIKEAEKPVAAEDEILYKVMVCGICPSDVRGWNRKGVLEQPRIPGHESVGEVTEVGDKVIINTQE